MSFWSTLTYPFRRGPRKPLTARQPKLEQRETPLGMEATDLDVVEATIRQNQSLERSGQIFGQSKGSFAQAADRTVRTFKDDETYAAEYHRTFGKKD